MLMAHLLFCVGSCSHFQGVSVSHKPGQLVLPSLQRSGFRRIRATSADGCFRYIVESVVNTDFTEAKR